jgi:hypothetical protein
MRQMKISKIILTILMGFTISDPIISQIVTDRPDQTESSSAVGKGNLQLESGILLDIEGEGLYSTRHLFAPTTLFRYGILNGMELRILSQFETQKTSGQSVSGISDIEIGAKLQVFNNENGHTKIAFLSHIIAPTGTRELTNSDFGIINKIAVSHELRENMSLGYNLGYSWYGRDNGDLTYSLSLGIGINGRTAIFIEPYGAIENLREFILNMDAGLTYLIGKNLQVDTSFGTGATDRMNFISIGCSWLISRE